EFAHQVEGLLPFGVASVAELNARLDAPEQIGREREITPGRETVAEIAHHLIDAEDFLDDDHCWPLAGFRRGQIAREIPIRSLDRNVPAGHGGCPLALRCAS